MNWCRMFSRTTWGLALYSLVLGLHLGDLPAFSQSILDIRVANNQSVQVDWDQGTTNYVVQQGTDLVLWDTVLKAPSLVGSNIVLTLNFPDGVPSLFLRLFAQETSGVAGGLNFLRDSQLPSGTWGSVANTMMRDTTAALQALLLIPDYQAAFDAGIGGLVLKPVRNNDDLARKTLLLARASQDVDTLVDDLFAVQNPTSTDPALAGFPGGGWGLTGGFDNDAIDTALCLRALKEADVPTGLSVVNETIPFAGSSPDHDFEVPAGASNLTLSVRTLTGNARFNLTQPSMSVSFVDLTAGGVPANINFGTPAPGIWSLSVDNNDAGAITYSAEVSYTTAEGDDISGLTAAATYLGINQNLDGGWSALAGADSHLMITYEVMQTLSRCGNAFKNAIDNGATWLFTNKKNGDGGFSSEPDNSNVQETALAVLAIRLSNLGLNISDSILFLKNAQLLNGSWGEDPYLTALASLAIAQSPVVSDIPDQVVVDPALFAAVNLDDFVDDPDHPDNSIIWTVTGNTQLGVSIVNRVATLTYPAATEVIETLVFTATDPDGLSDSDSATFTVSLAPLVDFTIARGGSDTGSRDMTGAQAVLDQVVTFQIQLSGVPSDVTYNTTSIIRSSPTAFTIGFQIDVGPGAPLGIHMFTVTYTPLDAGSQPVGPVQGNVFDFTIEITP